MIYEDVELMKLTKELTVVHKEYEKKYYERPYKSPTEHNNE